MVDLTKIRAMCDVTTPGPWEAGTREYPSYDGNRDFGFSIMDQGDDVLRLHDEKKMASNATFIAESRTLIPELCDEIERLRTANTRLQQDFDDQHGELISAQMANDVLHARIFELEHSPKSGLLEDKDG